MALYSRNVLVLPELIYTLGLHSSWCNELHNLIMCSLKYFLLSVFKIFLDNSIGISYCEEQQVIICISTPVILWISIHILLHSPTALHPQSRFRLLLILKLFCQHFLDPLYLFFFWGRIARTNIQDLVAPEVCQWGHYTFCIVLIFHPP